MDSSARASHKGSTRLGSYLRRLRAGYGYLPYQLAYLQPDRIDAGSDIQPVRNEQSLGWWDQEPARQIVSAGFGILLGRVLTLDAGLEYHLGERSIPTLVDKREMYRLTMSTSYRF